MTGGAAAETYRDEFPTDYNDLVLRQHVYSHLGPNHSIIFLLFFPEAQDCHPVLMEENSALEIDLKMMFAARNFRLPVGTQGKLQVWSLTQFYSVDFSNSRIGVKKCVFNKRTIKLCACCC